MARPASLMLWKGMEMRRKALTSLMMRRLMLKKIVDFDRVLCKKDKREKGQRFFRGRIANKMVLWLKKNVFYY